MPVTAFVAALRVRRSPVLLHAVAWILLASVVLAGGACGRAVDPATSDDLSSGRDRFRPGDVTQYFTCRALAFSPNGEMLAAGGSPGWVSTYDAQLWDTENYRQIADYPRLGSHAAGPTFESRAFVTGGWTGELSLSDIEDGRILNHRERGHADTIKVVEASPDGRFVFTAAEDGTATLWNAETLHAIGMVSGHAGGIRSATFTSDSKRLITGGNDAKVIIRDVSDPESLHSLPGAGWPVRALVVSPDGETLVTIGADACMPSQGKLWSLASEQILITFDRLCDFRFSPDGKSFAVSSNENSTVVVYDAETLVERFRVVGNSLSYLTVFQDVSIAFSPDSRTLAVGVDAVKLIDVANDRVHRQFTDLKKPVSVVEFSPDGQTLVAANNSGDLAFWDVTSGQTLHVASTGTYSASLLSYSRDGRRLLVGFGGSGSRSGSSFGTVQLVDSATGNVRKHLKGHTQTVTAVSFSPDGKRLATAAADRSVRLWEVDSARQVAVLAEQQAPVFALAIAPDGERLATGSRGVDLWNIARREVESQFASTTGLVYCLTYSADGRRLAAGDSEGNVHLWSTRDQREQWTSHVGWPVRALAFSPDGSRILVGGGEVHRGAVLLLDADAGRKQLELDGHRGAVTTVAYSADGLEIFSGSIDESIKVWDAATGRLHSTESGFESPVACLAIHPGGRALVAGTRADYRWFKR